MSFGQGYSVNTVQMASAIGTIANDGVRLAPRLVRQTTTPDGDVTTPAAPDGISAAIALWMIATIIISDRKERK